ncbi:hypothetical protein NMY3_01677 [Candidatus Nitrosocosmicus oleophilus]|jgi:hypothetical protein|uniref:Uncharacterized protein n=1 Tax=Candidatus Nitrosocosmicus oleophilus TaxID=1353260 RepID=A0A654LYP8_9ARCH|nr:hypothetical protein NMY3_01677 [Candidatus Nitrosocosmicus oleophilus]
MKYVKSSVEIFEFSRPVIFKRKEIQLKNTNLVKNLLRYTTLIHTDILTIPVNCASYLNRTTKTELIVICSNFIELELH